MTFWKFIRNKATETVKSSVELRIEGDIVDDDDIWIYELFGESATAPNKFKNELHEFKGQDLTVWIDSYGGSVFAGAGIYNALKEHDGKITVKIDSKAMSAASVIAMAGDEVLMSPVALMMIHNPLTFGFGDMHELRKTADVLDEVKETIINAYTLKTGLSRDVISGMMDDETYMSATTAVKNNFADETLYQDESKFVDEVANNFNFNRLAIVNNANESVKKAVQMFSEEKKTKPDNNKIINELKMELDLI